MAHLVQFPLPVNSQVWSHPPELSWFTRTTPLKKKKNTKHSYSFLRSHPLSIVPQWGTESLSRSLFHVGMLMGLVHVLCRQPRLVWVLGYSGPVIARRHCLTPVPPHPCYLCLWYTFCPLLNGSWTLGDRRAIYMFYLWSSTLCPLTSCELLS